LDGCGLDLSDALVDLDFCLALPSSIAANTSPFKSRPCRPVGLMEFTSKPNVSIKYITAGDKLLAVGVNEEGEEVGC